MSELEQFAKSNNYLNLIGYDIEGLDFFGIGRRKILKDIEKEKEHNMELINYSHELESLRELNESLMRENEQLRKQVRSLSNRLLYYKNFDKRLQNPKVKIVKPKRIETYNRTRFALRKALKSNPDLSEHIYVSDKRGALVPITLENISTCRGAFHVKDPYTLDKIF